MRGVLNLESFCHGSACHLGLSSFAKVELGSLLDWFLRHPALISLWMVLVPEDKGQDSSVDFSRLFFFFNL
jgi:hypothetical protein